MADPYDLDRFVTAQQRSYAQALAELQHGRKTSHWIWFVFPQIAGLGHSAMAQHYAIRDLAEARAYLAHPLLGPRLAEATQAMLAYAGTPAAAILGGIDAVKWRSSLTLFEAAGLEAAGGDPLYAQALETFYDGVRDPATLARI